MGVVSRSVEEKRGPGLRFSQGNEEGGGNGRKTTFLSLGVGPSTYSNTEEKLTTKTQLGTKGNTAEQTKETKKNRPDWRHGIY